MQAVGTRGLALPAPSQPAHLVRLSPRPVRGVREEAGALQEPGRDSRSARRPTRTALGSPWRRRPAASARGRRRRGSPGPHPARPHPRCRSAAPWHRPGGPAGTGRTRPHSRGGPAPAAPAPLRRAPRSSRLAPAVSETLPSRRQRDDRGSPGEVKERPGNRAEVSTPVPIGPQGKGGDAGEDHFCCGQSQTLSFDGTKLLRRTKSWCACVTLHVASLGSRVAQGDLKQCRTENLRGKHHKQQTLKSFSANTIYCVAVTV